jgi:hypothetical protein
MGALTSEERRRVFVARQQAYREGLARLAAPVPASELHSQRRRLHALLKAAMLVALLGTGLVAFHVVEFHMPASIAETLPRL